MYLLNRYQIKETTYRNIRRIYTARKWNAASFYARTRTIEVFILSPV